MINPIRFIDTEEDVFKYNLNREISRGTLKEVHIADLHFGALDPKYQYTILKEQVLDKIECLDLDIIAIDGDLYDHKCMANSDIVMYCNKFIDDLISYCRRKGTILVIIDGTYSHDADQLKLYYHYLEDSTVDIRIVEDIKFEYIKGAKILCIPERYKIDEDKYRQFLFYSGLYDSVFMHGTIKGAIFGDTCNSRLFKIEDFCNCLGPIISGHVHVAGCFNSYFYYCGSPYRWCFGEEGEKGFLIVLHNLDNNKHYIHLEPIQSFRYETIDINSILCSEPKKVIDYINNLKQTQGIDYIRIQFDGPVQNDNLELIKRYYKNNSTVKIKLDNVQRNNIAQPDVQSNELDEYNYLLDKSLSEYEILTRYINQQKGEQYITVEELTKIIEEDI